MLCYCRVADTRMLSTNHPIVYIDGSKLVLKVIHTSNSDRMYTISAASSSIILTMYDRIVTDVTATSNATVATADEPEGEYYSFDFVPDPHFGLGLRLDTGQASGAVFVHSFKRPGKDTILKLEAMGIISIGDELIGINGKYQLYVHATVLLFTHFQYTYICIHRCRSAAPLIE